MKKEILDILDKSTSNSMKADEIVDLVSNLIAQSRDYWRDILDVEERNGDDVMWGLSSTMFDAINEGKVER